MSKAKPATIRDRIVDFRRVPARELKPHPSTRGGTGGSDASRHSASVDQPLPPLADERWAPIPSAYGNYAASTLGRVRRAMPGRNTWPGRLLPQRPHAGGYRVVTLQIDGCPALRLVHRLVAEAFLGSCPRGREVNHRNGDKTDNRLVNLEYVTRSENIRHSMALEMHALEGEDNPCAKLTYGQVAEIRLRHIPGTLRIQAAGRGVRRELGDHPQHREAKDLEP